MGGEFASRCFTTAAFSDQWSCPRWRVSAPHWPLVAMFPQVSPHLLLHSARAAVGGLRSVLESSSKAAAAAGEESHPTHPDASLARVPHDPRQAAMVSSRRALSATCTPRSQIVPFSATPCALSNNDLARGRRRGSAAVRPQPHERPETGARHRACLHAVQHAAHLMRTHVGTLEYHTHGRCRASSNVRGC